jgi:hypothetical protein
MVPLPPRERVVSRALLRHEAARAYNLLRAKDWQAAVIREAYIARAARARSSERAALYRTIAERAAVEA